MRTMSTKRVRLMEGLGCVILFLLLMAGPVAKAEEARIYIDQVEVEDGKCIVYVNQNQGEGWQPTLENSSLTINNQAAVIESVEMLKNVDIPMSYVIMVDVSGSMSRSRIEEIKEMIYQFVDGKKEVDNFCITVMGNNLTSSEILQNPDEIKACVSGIAVTKEDTNLYQSVKNELAWMQKQEGLHLKKTLIIFSDGAEDQATGITREEAENAVKESHIPVFTVAMLKKKFTEAQAASAKVLGSFGRTSAGGAHYAPNIEGYGNQEVYGKVQSILNSSFQVKASADGMDIREGSANIGVTLSGGVTAAATERKVSGAVAGKIAELSKTKIVASEGLEETESQEEEKGTPMPAMLVISGIVLVIALIAVIVMKKRRMENLEEGVEFRKKAQVKLTQLSGSEEQYDFRIRDEIKIGRSRRCHLSLKDDKALSEVHCSLWWRQGALYVQDGDSTNGTYVNGVPVIGEYKLEQGDILLLGSHEYKVNWEE